MRRFRFLAASVVAAALAVPLGWPAVASADDAPIEQQIVDAFVALFGDHPGQRVNHAKGILVEGEFAAAPGAAALTSAAHLQAGSKVPVTARFSDGTGLPDIADGSPNANPHGIAVKFHLPDGSDTDIVINALHFFPVATPEEFRDLLRASAATKPDSPKPTKLDAFLADHPNVKRAGATVKTPKSFATEDYYGINAFQFVNAKGERRFIRYVMDPLAGVAHLEKDEAAKQPPNFLIDEIQARLRQGPVQFRLLAQVAAAGDPTNDATKPWPDDRQRVELGTLTLSSVVPDNQEASRQILFLPGQVTDGIEPSDDPLLPVRDASYAISFSRRSQ